MIELLFGLIFTEMTLIVLFVFKTSLRKLVIMGLDYHKCARSTIVVKPIAGTIFLLMLATAYNVVATQRHWIQDAAEVNPTDQVLLVKHLLEASLMGKLREQVRPSRALNCSLSGMPSSTRASILVWTR